MSSVLTQRSHPFLTVAAALWLSVAAGAGRAQQALPYGPDVDLEVAQKIATRALDEARKNHWRLAVAVVDTRGLLVYFARLDDTQTASALVAVEKARTAAMFRRASRVFEEGLAKRPAYLGLPGVTPVTGGVPIVVDGKIIGGIGASGVASDDDELAVKAGLLALVRNPQ